MDASAPPIRLPAGVRDFLPVAAARRRALAERVLGVFEVADVLERGLGADARAAAIRFVEPGTGEVVALRPDITPQVARLAATRMRDVRGPLRLCYEGAVTRLAGAHGQREILQAGIELIDGGAGDGAGVAAAAADDSIAEDPDRAAGRAAAAERDARRASGDAEVLAVAAAALAAVGLHDVRLDVGHVAPVAHVLDAAGAAAPRLRAALGRKDRAGVAAIARALPEPTAALARELVNLWGDPDAVLARARALAWPAAVAAALDRVAAAIAGARALAAGAPAVAITLDLGEVRGFDYYTGLRFAGYAAGAADAVVRGGRYDELLARYGYPALATGFAVDLEAVAEADADAALFAPAGAVVIAGAEPAAAAALAAALRRAGVGAAIDPTVRADAAALAAYLAAAGYAAAVVVTGAGARRLDPSGAESPIAAAAIASALAGDGAPLARALGSTSQPQE